MTNTEIVSEPRTVSPDQLDAILSMLRFSNDYSPVVGIFDRQTEILAPLFPNWDRSAEFYESKSEWMEEAGRG